MERFEALKSNNATSFMFDKVAEIATITAPESIMPEKSLIIHKKGIVTPNEN